MVEIAPMPPDIAAAQVVDAGTLPAQPAPGPAPGIIHARSYPAPSPAQIDTWQRAQEARQRWIGPGVLHASERARQREAEAAAQETEAPGLRDCREVLISKSVLRYRRGRADATSYSGAWRVRQLSPCARRG
jgi:hypothetical protein